MNKKKILHISLGFVIAFVLYALYLQSQIDQQQHLAITKTLLTLKENDIKLSQSIIQNQTGLHKNFDTISLSQQQINESLTQLTKLFRPYTTSEKTLRDDLSQLITLEKEKSLLISHYRQSAALNKFTKQYLPKAFAELIATVKNATDIDKESKSLLKREINLLNTNINHYIAGYEHNEEKLKTMSTDLRHTTRLLGERSKSLTLLSRYINKVIKTNNDMHVLVQKVQYIKTIEQIDTIRQRYITLFNDDNRDSIKYKNLLFTASIALLIYLMLIFTRLQSTSSNLKETLTDLKFRKQALDKHAIVSVTDVKGNILYVNEKFCEISQYTNDDLIGKTHSLIKSDRHDKQFYQDMWGTIANGGIWQGEICNQAKDGSLYWVATTLIPRLNKNGKPYEYIGMRTDITAQKIAESEIISLARFPMENPEPVIRVIETGEVIFQNDAAQILLDHWDTKNNKHIPDEWIIKINNTLTTNEIEEIEINVDAYHYLLILTPVLESGYVNIYGRNITDKKRAEDSLSYQANHDRLTGLFNRYAFERDLKNAIMSTRVNATQHILLYVDLDQFKIVNDTCGHIAGDELLRQLSHMMLSVFREHDTVARLGGDEFGVLLLNCDLKKGNKIARKLLDLVNNYRFTWDSHLFEIGASIGLVEINKNSDSIVSVLGNADIACYSAKDAGRNQIKIYNSKDSDSVQRHSELQWASQIPKALAENRFQLMVQTITPLKNDKKLKPHYEILLRMIGVDGKLIPPGVFIPAAERYNLMSAIDHWVVVHVFKFLNKFLECNPLDDMPILAINLSGESMGSEELLAFIRAQFELVQLPAENICFEITETSAIANLTKAISFINSLKEVGCKFALDDFGSGLSSFSYLKSLPVDYLKIDGVFVKGIVDNPIDAAMVDSINQVGHIMNIETIAEFVETAEIMDALTEIGVDYAQGYHIDKPMPLDMKFPINQKVPLKKTG